MTSYALTTWRLPLSLLTPDVDRTRLAIVLVVSVTAALSLSPKSAGATSDFYYDHWQCNNYLSGETVVVAKGSGKLVELHIRDNIPVSSKSFH